MRRSFTGDNSRAFPSCATEYLPIMSSSRVRMECNDRKDFGIRGAGAISRIWDKKASFCQARCIAGLARPFDPMSRDESSLWTVVIPRILSPFDLYIFFYVLSHALSPSRSAASISVKLKAPPPTTWRVVTVAVDDHRCALGGTLSAPSQRTMQRNNSLQNSVLRSRASRNPYENPTTRRH